MKPGEFYVKIEKVPGGRRVVKVETEEGLFFPVRVDVPAKSQYVIYCTTTHEGVPGAAYTKFDTLEAAASLAAKWNAENEAKGASQS